MIKVFHGENIVESRRALSAVIQKAANEGIETVSRDGSKVELPDLRVLLDSDTLLGKNRIVVLENLFSSQKSKRKETLIAFISKYQFANDLVIWESKEIGKTILPKNAEINIFKISSKIFKFLDSFRLGNSKEALGLFNELKKTDGPDMVFYMLIRHIRLLILAKDMGVEGLGNMADWQKSNVVRQANTFSLDILISYYQKFEDIDLKQKTSSGGLSLEAELDLLLSSL